MPFVSCVVVNGGEFCEHKGINLPGIELSVPSFTSKDRVDLAFALDHGANYVAVSFVRRPEIAPRKSLIRRAGNNTPVIAKLEKPEAIDNLDAILHVADGVMVARGDLGVEMSPERVPVVQKKVIDRARPTSAPRNHRHANARIHDRKSPAHSRGSFRRGQRDV